MTNLDLVSINIAFFSVNINLILNLFWTQKLTLILLQKLKQKSRLIMIKDITSQNIHSFLTMCTAHQIWNIKSHFYIFICSTIHIIEGVCSPKQIFGTVFDTCNLGNCYGAICLLCGWASISCRLKEKVITFKIKRWLQPLIYKDANSSMKTSRKDESVSSPFPCAMFAFLSQNSANSVMYCTQL